MADVKPDSTWRMIVGLPDPEQEDGLLFQLLDVHLSTWHTVEDLTNSWHTLDLETQNVLAFS